MRSGAFIALALALLAPHVAAQNTPSLKDVVQRAEHYVDSYGEKASIVVGTERYEQESRSSASPDPLKRTLVSDIAIVRADAIRGWLGFRDVIEVDGRPQSNREDRLVQVLMGAEGRYDEARRLSDESARYNIGAIERNFNVPTTALFFFTRENHDRFKFAARRVTSDGTWEISFRETSTPTLIRTPEGRSVQTSGTIWVEPESGTVVRSVLTMEMPAGRGRGTGQLDVTYRRLEALNMWLPATMDEQFEVSLQVTAGRGGGMTPAVWVRVSGRAEYSNYRQFTTSGRIK